MENLLPDAPWIRDAELNGVPADDPVLCPICGEECDTIFEDDDGTAFGCENCVRKRDAYDWFSEMRDGEEEDGWHDER